MMTNQDQPDEPRVTLPSRLIASYEASDFSEDLGQFTRSIDALIQQGHEYLNQKDYELTGLTFTDVSDLRVIYDHITQGRYERAAKQIDDLDTAVRDEIPTRLYDKIMKFHR
ncbi:hypothetical protein HED60_13975 [Planctomycetales bacterium ZRK34]|nr:hypothetical protein HED60_13975 [Planctomycetales bacterium ZRK34]